jgi:hypothetical protein
MRVITLYKTPSPGISIKSGEYYELSLDSPDGSGFVLSEFHGNWDATKEAEPRKGPPAPHGPTTSYDSLEAGELAFDKQRIFRAKEGFMHGFIPTFDAKTMQQVAAYEFVDADAEL